MKFEGLWHIYEMENWDEDYFNMDVQAYVELNESGGGGFQFGLVSGYIDGEFIKVGKKIDRLEFTWEGNDESDDASGSGWLKVKAGDKLDGYIKMHQGDSSRFKARRA
jgi:hypothetical protein